MAEEPTTASTGHSWEQRYQKDDTPWDARRPEPQLVEEVLRVEVSASLVLDLGCGTGDNTIAMTSHGHRVVGLDLSPSALATAHLRARQTGCSQASFVCADLLRPLPIAELVGFVIDRGCWHLFDHEQRSELASHVAEVLVSGGFWIMLCGNADEQRAEGEEGPPQLTAEQVVAPIEPYFEVQRLEQRQFTGSGGQPTHLAWKAILRRRSHNQTPSG